MNKYTLILLTSLVVVGESCRTTKFVPAANLPPDVAFPTNADPISGKPKHAKQTIAIVEKPGKGDIELFRDTLVLVEALVEKGYSLYRVKQLEFALLNEDFTMKPNRVLYDWTGAKLGAIRLEFDSCACSANTELKYSHRDSLLKKGDLPSKLIVRNPAIEWGQSEGIAFVPRVSCYTIDMVDRDTVQYLLIPRLKGGNVCEPLRLHRDEHDFGTKRTFYEPELRSVTSFGKDEKGHMTYGNRQLKRKPFLIIKEMPLIKGSLSRRHKKRNRVRNF
jgi:hypothetical protein